MSQKIGKEAFLMKDTTSLPHVPAQLAQALQDHAARPAIRDANLALSYGQLADCIHRLRPHLPQGAVAVFGKPSALFSVAVVTAVVAGRPFVHLDPAMPQDVLSNILSELAIGTVLVTEPPKPGQLPAAAQLVAVDQVIAGYGDAPPAPIVAGDVAPDDIIYLVATSGTTGKPKCIPVTQDAAYLSYLWRDQYTPYGPDQVVGIYIFAIWEMFRPLRDGAALVIPTFSELMNPEALLAFLARHAVTEMLFTPSAFDKSLQGWRASALGDLPLRRIILNGEVVSDALIAAAAEKLPDATLWNLYSICETHDISMTCVSDRSAPPAPESVGRAMPYLTPVVLDDHDQPCPPDVPGLLHFMGPRMLGPGYVNRAEETALRFRELTLDGQSVRLYDTGDQGYIRPDGTIHVLGRVAHMLKLRGHSIQTRELTASLQDFLGFAQGLPWVRDVDGAGKVLVFYYCADRDQMAQNKARWGLGAGQARMPRDLAQALAQVLPGYCIPRYLVQMDAMPLNPVSGKCDLKALPAIIPDAQAADADLPQWPVLRAAAEVMGMAPADLDPDLSFHDQGGDSLMAVNLLLALEAAYARPVDFELALHVPLGRLHDLLSVAQDQPSHDLRADRPGVLLTGVTGFLGRHVLATAAAHLPQDQAIYCLIRPKRRDPQERLEAMAAELGIDPARLVLLPAALEDAQFGLQPAAYAALTARVHQVIHCAAMVNLAVDRDHMENWSQAGMDGIVQFCRDAGAELRFSSSSAVFADQGGLYPEGRAQPYPHCSGYGAAKIAAEAQIADAGIDAAIIRLPSLYDLAAPNPSDIYEIILAAAARLGAVPQGLTFRMIDVRAAARMLVHLPQAQGLRYLNLTPDIYADLAGYPALPQAEWLAKAPLSATERQLIASDLSVLQATATLDHARAKAAWDQISAADFATISDPAALISARLGGLAHHHKDPALT
jgi:acyl-coenzyme A synthetase/AMP-(fatty) acid ligase/nucleoside-diphosphate-sugar epimerase/acyl carrier protein